VTIVLSLGFISLYKNESVLLRSKGEESGNTLVLNGKTSDKELSQYLLNKGIYQDPKDAECISKWITSRIGNTIPNLGALNKSQFRMPADTLFGLPIAEVGGEKVRLAVETSQLKLGITPDVKKLYAEIGKEPLDPAKLISLKEGTSYRYTTKQMPGDTIYTRVSIRVLRTKKGVDTLTVRSYAFKYHTLCRIPYIGSRIADKLLNGMKQSRKNQEGITGVLVRVRDHSIDKSGVDLGFVSTDSSGLAVVYLPSNGHYSFLPVREGFEYGSSKGTRRGVLGYGDIEYTFNQKRHTIKPIDTQTYLRIKEDILLSVRSPKDYKNALLFYPCIFFIAWWLLFFFFAWYDYKRKTQTDFIIPLALMSLSGIGLLAMFSIVNPLTDTLLGSTMTYGAVVGILVLGLVSCADWGFFYSVGIKGKKGIVQFDFVLQFIRWISLPFMKKIQSFKIEHKAGLGQKIGYYVKLLIALLLIPFELLFRLIGLIASSLDRALKKLTIYIFKNPSERVKHWARSPFNGTAPKGFGYIVIVLFFILLLQLFGDGPEGSGTKVNLLFFQPSELNKYLVVIFMAAFFAVRADRITMFSDVADRLHLRLQIKTVILVLLSLVILLGLYMVVMSDMGPALVLIVTFVFLYAIARKDFKQMLFGIITFVGMVWLGGIINENSLFTKFLLAIAWLAVWIIFWYVKDRRLYESAIFFNLLLSAFIFVGPWLAKTNSDTFRNVGQRIVDRNEVAMHLWNNSVRGGGDQVVQGIWSLATGGFAGQGLGQGNPNLVPAFHTDMIFTSIGEEMGWVSLMLIILCLAIIIHRSLVIAYKSGDRFLFFLTSGIAIVTGVQFFVIILGSIGLIPLTGVAVPFLSFGMTSLIINLAVFGIVISVSRKNATQNQREINRPYRYVTSVGIGSFLTVSIVLVAILFQYQVLPITRNNYLVKPAFVSNNEGHRLREYNPRIRLLLKELHAGNIKDRNGLLLATSEKESFLSFVNYKKKAIVTVKENDNTHKIDTIFDYSLFKAIEERSGYLSKEEHREHSRYYPFGDNTFFVLGDFNTQTLWGINELNPYGYLAEERLLGVLRGFSTAISEDGKNSVELGSDKYYSSPFASPKDTSFTYTLYNYRPLLRYLKDGVHGRKVKAYNKKTQKGERDVYLTIDAKLQTLLQKQMYSYLNSPEKCSYNTKSRPKIRASVVILDAVKGDVITSSNYPLPNQDSIRKYQDLKIDYSKYEREWRNPVFADRDLGLTYLTNPGSTAKIMSAIAGFMKLEDDMQGVKYHIDAVETIEGAGKEPNSSLLSPNLANSYPDKNWRLNSRLAKPDNCSNERLKEYELVHLEEAIVWSSNNYFINLVHNKQLYGELGQLYQTVGARVGNDETNRLFMSYFFDQKELTSSRRSDFDNCVSFVSNRANKTYQDYLLKHDMEDYHTMNNGAWMWAWGQGSLDASPLTMARVASVIYNEGQMPLTRFVYATGENMQHMTKVEQIPIISRSQAALLKQFMKEETTKHRSITRSKHPHLPMSMGGKTGTPERYIHFSGTRKGIKVNDGWYICFVDSEYTTKEGKSIQIPLAIAVRLERIGATSMAKGDNGGSGLAVSFIENTVVPVLKDCNYNVK
jgi:cell division protein FtsW (lipid II flippase)/cell division protein FtsI/penicillin-binding protein 2